MMGYVLIFAGSYMVAFVSIFVRVRNSNNLVARRLHEFGCDDKEINDFKQNAAPPLLFIQPTFFIGTLVGIVGSLIFWSFA